MNISEPFFCFNFEIRLNGTAGDGDMKYFTGLAFTD